MEYKSILFFFVVILFSHPTTDAGTAPAGIFEDIIDNIRLTLRNVSMPHVDFDTKQQEFGRLNATLDNVTVTELDRFEIVTLDTTVFPVGISNLTVRFPSFLVRGKYKLGGTLKFPIGNEPLSVFGNGSMTIKFGESHSFTKIIIGSKAGKKVVKDLGIDFNITTMTVNMENLMGGGLLEKIFNEYFSTIGPTLYNYYKSTLLEELKKPLIDEITKLLNEIL